MKLFKTNQIIKLSKYHTNVTKPFQSLVICGPSGSGKGTLIQKILETYPNSFQLSVSHTSRSPRPGEIDGYHYHFKSLEYIENDIKNGKIPYIEYAYVHNNLYGTRQDAVDMIHDQKKVCILDVDVNGVKQLKNVHFHGKYLFIRPLTLNDLEKRLRKRNTENESTILLRLENAKKELEYASGSSGSSSSSNTDSSSSSNTSSNTSSSSNSSSNKGSNFDKILINDSLDAAWKELDQCLHDWFPSYLPPK
jgi:guanylate kinase